MAQIQVIRTIITRRTNPLSKGRFPPPGSTHKLTHSVTGFNTLPPSFGFRFSLYWDLRSVSITMTGWWKVCVMGISKPKDRLMPVYHAATGDHLPSPLSLYKSIALFTGSRFVVARERLSWRTHRLISSPFTILPTLFASSILAIPFILPPFVHLPYKGGASVDRSYRSQYHAADVLLASTETVLTFIVAYPAAVALGKVLLQTAPERGLAGGQMESFLRLMREV